MNNYLSDDMEEIQSDRNNEKTLNAKTSVLNRMI